MEIINKLLENGDFDDILNKYELYKYELLEEISSILFPYPSHISSEEANLLKSIYINKAIMFKLDTEKVMLISDTHMGNDDFERLDYLNYIASFCMQNQIHHLIHAGDIGDGTKNGKPLSFPEFKGNEALEQSQQIVEKYIVMPDVTQFVLGGNHDTRYIDHQNKVDILKLLANKKNIYPLGFIQAFFTVCGQVISLEHSSNRIYEESLISHELAIKGHSHLWQPQNNILYIPTLSNYIYHKGKEEGKAGFVIMQPIQTNDGVILHFDRYTFIETNNFLSASKTAEKAYTLTRKKEM